MFASAKSLFQFRVLAALLVLTPMGSPASADMKNLLETSQRVMFLGDSITNAGGYIVQLEARLLSRSNSPELINLGLPSETCSGLSEPAHPFPRPDVHERLDRALKIVKPEVVFACYGMNDGIYYPLDETRFQKFQDGITRLVEKCKAAGAKVVLLTPPPFDPLPLQRDNKLKLADAKDFDWRTPYENYADVIEKYAEWVLAQRDEVDDVIDVFHPILKYVEAKRADDPNFALSEDGVHMNHEGHEVLANAILQHYEIEPTAIDSNLLDLVSKRQQIMHAAWLTKVGHKRPGVQPGLPMEEAKAKAKQIALQFE